MVLQSRWHICCFFLLEHVPERFPLHHYPAVIIFVCYFLSCFFFFLYQLYLK